MRGIIPTRKLTFLFSPPMLAPYCHLKILAKNPPLPARLCHPSPRSAHAETAPASIILQCPLILFPTDCRPYTDQMSTLAKAFLVEPSRVFAIPKLPSCTFMARQHLLNSHRYVATCFKARRQSPPVSSVPLTLNSYLYLSFNTQGHGLRRLRRSSSLHLQGGPSFHCL